VPLRRLPVVVLVVVGLMVRTTAPASALTETWTSVGAGTLSGVSGLVTTDSGWLIVRDNKKPTQNRVALLDDAGTVTPLVWPGTPPVDLESVDRVPSLAATYAAAASTGQTSVISVDGTTVTLVRQFALPAVTRGVEALALAVVDGQTIAVWATRGSTTAAAKVFAATFDPLTAGFGPVVSGKIRVPYPTVSVRQVSDLKVFGGRLLISSTSDPGSLGPFDSAVYDGGSVSVVAGQVALQLTTPLELARYSGHKVEGVACGFGVAVVGADDEKAGGAVRTDSFCS
jgi:hypothetical protein